jgi:hypothetical protein
VAIFGRGSPLENLEDLVDDRVAAGTKPANDLKLPRWFGSSRTGERRDEANNLSLEVDAFADNVARLKHILENR